MEQLLTALALLLDPANVQTFTPDPLTAWQLQAIAVQWEILDHRETRYVLIRATDLAGDLSLLRRRLQDLAGAPRVNDCLRFPDRATVNDFLAFNRAYRWHLAVRQDVQLHDWHRYRQALAETDRLYLVWDLVRDARCEYYYVTVRRGALQRLREAVGEEAYYSGRLPPYVPLGRFAATD